MAVDYISTLNKNGSGLNLTELASSIAQAESAPKIAAANRRKAEAEVAISAYGKLRAAFEDFEGALGYLEGTSVLAAQSGSSAVSVTVSDRAAVSETTSSVDVIEIAKRQVLEFTGFTSPEDAIGTGDLTIEFGVWTDDTNFAANPNYPGSSITIGAGATLQELAEALSSLDGVTARVLDRGDGTYTLGVVSEEGAGRALRMSVDPAATGLMTTFDNTATNATVQVQAATDAMLTVDGVTVFRPTNVIDDVIDGLTLTLNGTTEYATAVSVSRDADLALQVLDTFVSQVNTTLSTLRGMIAYGTEDSDAGDLYGDRTARQLLDQFTSILKQPLTGHRDKPIHLSDLGIATSRDGSIYLNKALFERSFEKDPEAFDQVFSDTFRSGSSDLTVTGKANDSTKSGSYDFSFDPVAGTATLGNSSLFATVLDGNKMRFVAISGDMAGAVISTGTSAVSGSVSYGRSMVSTLRLALNDALQTNGTLDKRELYFTNLMEEQDALMTVAEEKAADLETRYLKRFAAMEQAISALKATGTYLENLVASWNSD